MANANKTTKYKVDIPGFFDGPIGWKGGKPTVANLEAFVMDMVVSTYPGFINEHLGKDGIKIPNVATIMLNDHRNVIVAEFKAAAFQVMPKAEDHPNVAKAI